MFLISPLVLGYVIFRAFKDGGFKYFQQRLGFSYSEFDSRPIHFHCASVGEYITAKPLIDKLQQTFQNTIIIVTTNTPTAASLINKNSNQNPLHYYFPIDFAFPVKRFLKKVHPVASIILETEIWPNYYSHAAKYAIYISIINARLSDKTFQVNSLLKKEYARTLQNVNLILARSRKDKDKYIQLGAKTSSTHTIGNLKYTISESINKTLACTTIKRPFFLAASTHQDEELQLTEHMELLKRKNYLLILAPRYPERCKQLAEQLTKLGMQIALRSQHDQIHTDTDIYIIDTLGELNMFFNEAALVFIGGSLVKRGGHNVLEPANFGKCILVGPYTENFTLEIEELSAANAIVQVNNNYELGENLIKLLNNDGLREEYGASALTFMQQKSGVLNQYLKHLTTAIAHAK